MSNVLREQAAKYKQSWQSTAKAQARRYLLLAVTTVTQLKA
jgi:hypothetical protein